MSRLLFIVPGTPLAFNHSGAASRYTQNFLALQSLGEEIHVLRFHTTGRLQATLDFEILSETVQKVRRSAASWQDIELAENYTSNRLESLHRAFFDPLTAEFPQHKFLARAIWKCIDSLDPSLLWAEHSDAAAAVWSMCPSIPWVYSQTDMRYLIRSIRKTKSDLHQAVYDVLARNIEHQVNKGANMIITGSFTEKKRLEETGARNVKMIPMIHHNFPGLDPDFPPLPDVQLIHLGALETTANRQGLISYLSQAHPYVLEQTDVTLMIVGDASRIKSPLSKLLLQPRIICTGYIPDLATVLRPYDIAILPYPHDSGYRTKLPLLMGHAQAIVATRKAVVGSLLPGLDQVCILVERIEDFPQKIAWLAAHPEERKRIGLAGRAFAEQHFSANAVQPLYADLMRQIAHLQASKHNAG